MNNFEAQTITACPHPILPVERLINIEDQTEKIKLAFYKDKKWQNIIVSKGMIANTGTITKLSDRGIEVNSNTAKELVNYLSDIINLNLTTIPLKNSTEHLGWVGTEFAPYTTDLVYDGDSNFKDVYEAVKTKGKYDEWKKEIVKLRSKSKVLRFVMASSFASPLIKILGLNSYVVHLWRWNWNRKNCSINGCYEHLGKPCNGKAYKNIKRNTSSFSQICKLCT